MFETFIPLGIADTDRNRETLESIARKIDGSSVADPPPQFEARERELILRAMNECQPQLVISFPRLQFDREHSVFHLSCNVTWLCTGGGGGGEEEDHPRRRYFRDLLITPYCGSVPHVLKDNTPGRSNEEQPLLECNPAKVWSHVIIEDTFLQRDASLNDYLDHATRPRRWQQQQQKQQKQKQQKQQQLGCPYETYLKIMWEFANSLSPGVDPKFITLLVDRLFQHLPVRAICGIVFDGNYSPRLSRPIGLAALISEVPSNRGEQEKQRLQNRENFIE